ncbi:putative glutaminase 2 [Lepeophtheirus salmonis]|nr:putative glutaminase 2 [Lepeophtheirus salmonis]
MKLKEAAQAIHKRRSNLGWKIFHISREHGDQKCSINTFLETISRTGIRPYTDPRCASLIHALQSVCIQKKEQNIENLYLDLNEFMSVYEKSNHVFLERIFIDNLAIPDFEYFTEKITELFEEIKQNEGGKPASYIPQLGRVSPKKWGLSICTVDGQRLSLGDCKDEFTIQSTSKPITYALCLAELGEKLVHKYQGHEPSGRMFNEIVLDGYGKPHNPMINSGAIMSAAILLNLVKPELNISDKFNYVYNFFKKMAGDEFVGFNNSIFISERDTADRNNALAYFMRVNNCFPSGDNSIQDILDFYFQTCSLKMNSDSNSVLAATLANGGVCPTTNETILPPVAVKDVLSLMLSCGLYNYSGEFFFKVGLPGKSGVGGSLILVVPELMGITLWSPSLDDNGNTVRGVQFCEKLVKMFNFNKSLDSRLCNKINPRLHKNEQANRLLASLLKAAEIGDLNTLKSSYYQGVDMNVCDYDSRTPLHIAAAYGHVKVVKFLTEICKVNLNCKDRWGLTPIEESMNADFSKITKVLRIAMCKASETEKSATLLSTNDIVEEAAARFIQIRFRGSRRNRNNSEMNEIVKLAMAENKNNHPLNSEE